MSHIFVIAGLQDPQTHQTSPGPLRTQPVQPPPARPAFEMYRLPQPTYPSQPAPLRYTPPPSANTPGVGRGAYVLPTQVGRQPTGYTPRILPRYVDEFPDIEEDLNM